MTLCAFDLLELDGVDLRPEPIEVCKRTLEGLLRREHRGIAFNRHFDGEGTIIYKHACALGCEGIVSKRLGSSYRPGRQDCWIKVKNRLRQQCVARRRKIGANAGSPLPAALDRRGAQRRLLHREGTNPQHSRTTGLHSPHNRAERFIGRSLP